MKLLISAFACEPNCGSEPEIGWDWASALARSGHEVWVITHSFHRKGIEAELIKRPIPRLTIVYYGLWGKGGYGQKNFILSYGYYFLWQCGIVRVARQLARKIPFDLIHHLTYTSFRIPSFLAFLNIPFVLGPLCGAERAPHALRAGFTAKGYLKDLIRDLSSYWTRIDPIVRAVYRRAAVILCNTKETLSFIPKAYRHKCSLTLELGISSDDILKRDLLEDKAPATRPFRILYVGRLLYWKGIHLALAAVRELKERFGMKVTLTIVGRGPDEPWLRRIATRYHMESEVEWTGWQSRSDVMQRYSENDLFLFPSLHDSAGYVVLEALARGLPVMCLDLGGPPNVVNLTCGRVIITKGLSQPEVIRRIARSLKELADNPDERFRLSQGAITCAEAYVSNLRIPRIYREVILPAISANKATQFPC